MCGNSGIWRAMGRWVCGGCGVLFHLGYLWTLVLFGVGGGVDMYEGLICILVVICRILDSRFGMLIVVFL